MGRYFFDVSDGTRVIRDREGTELPGLAAVQQEVFDFGQKILQYKFSYGIEDLSRWSIRVMNEDHRVLTRIPLDQVKRLRRHLT
jgi:hypothetical protein